MIAEVGQRAKSHDLRHAIERRREHTGIDRATFESEQNVRGRTSAEQGKISIRRQATLTQKSSCQCVRGRTDGRDADDFVLKVGDRFYLRLRHKPKGRLGSNETDDLNRQTPR